MDIYCEPRKTRPFKAPDGFVDHFNASTNKSQKAARLHALNAPDEGVGRSFSNKSRSSITIEKGESICIINYEIRSASMITACSIQRISSSCPALDPGVCEVPCAAQGVDHGTREVDHAARKMKNPNQLFHKS